MQETPKLTEEGHISPLEVDIITISVSVFLSQSCALEIEHERQLSPRC